jgi:hypothetical protein
MIERRRENTVVKQMGHGSMAAWAVEQVTIGATDDSAHVTVLMREPLHEPVPWAEIPADPSLSRGLLPVL